METTKFALIFFLYQIKVFVLQSPLLKPTGQTWFDFPVFMDCERITRLFFSFLRGKVALAAALYRKPQILLLNEPFVFMDKEMAGFCLQLLQCVKDKMIILLFSGNESLVEKSDNVLYFKNWILEEKRIV